MTFSNKKAKESEPIEEERDIDIGVSNYKIGVSLALCVVCFFAVAAVTTRRMSSVHFSVI